MHPPARAAGLDFIRLATPTTDDRRLPAVLRNASGFVYYVSIAGITGAAAPTPQAVAPEVARIKAAAGLPGAGGLWHPHARGGGRHRGGGRTGCVVGSAIVAEIEAGRSVDEVLAYVARLAEGAHGATAPSRA